MTTKNAIEKTAVRDASNKLSVVSEMNRDIFMDDIAMDQRNAQEIEEGEYSLADLPENDDYGEETATNKIT